MDGFILFALIAVACLAGLWAAWRLDGARHWPFITLTGAIGSIILIGALIATAESARDFSRCLGLAAIFLASAAMVGGFVLTGRAVTPARETGED